MVWSFFHVKRKKIRKWSWVKSMINMDKKKYMLPVVRLQVIRERSIEYGCGTVDNPQKAAELVRDLFLENADREYLVVCCLDTKLKPLSVEIAAIGSLNQCIVNPRDIFKNAILSNSANILVLHNHPSGDAQASMDDDRITQRLKAAGELLGIPLVDHIIIGRDCIFSFREEERL